MKQTRWFVFVVLAVLLLAMVTPAFAQDVPPGVSPVFQAPSPDAVVSALFAALLAAFATAIQSPVTAPIVSLIKRLPVPLIQNASGDQLNLGVAVIASIVTWIAVTLGFGAQVDTVWKLIYAVLPIMVGAGANFVSNQSVYQYGVKRSIPVLGYRRPEKPNDTAS